MNIKNKGNYWKIVIKKKKHFYNHANAQKLQKYC